MPQLCQLHACPAHNTRCSDWRATLTTQVCLCVCMQSVVSLPRGGQLCLQFPVTCLHLQRRLCHCVALSAAAFTHADCAAIACFACGKRVPQYSAHFVGLSQRSYTLLRCFTLIYCVCLPSVRAAHARPPLLARRRLVRMSATVSRRVVLWLDCLAFLLPSPSPPPTHT